MKNLRLIFAVVTLLTIVFAIAVVVAPAQAKETSHVAIATNLTSVDVRPAAIDANQNHGAVVMAMAFGGQGLSQKDHRLAMSSERSIASRSVVQAPVNGVRCVVTQLTSEMIELTCPKGLFSSEKPVFDIPRASFSFPVHVNRAFIVYREPVCRGMEDEEVARWERCPAQNIDVRLRIRETREGEALATATPDRFVAPTTSNIERAERQDFTRSLKPFALKLPPESPRQPKRFRFTPLTRNIAGARDAVIN